jgi:hypothetical protein
MIGKIERIDGLPYGRAYKINDGEFLLPSVTSILKLIKVEKYEELKKDFTEEGWIKLLNDSSERGNIMHRMLEIFLIEWNKEKDIERALKKAQIFAIEESRKDDEKYSKAVERGRKLFWNFYHNKFWENISEILDNEVFLFTTFKGGWAGTTDFVYINKEGDIIVEDFKSSTFSKGEEEILAYKLQISAYMFMCTEKYGRIPKMGKISIANEKEDELQFFIVHDWEMKDYLRKFLELLEKFKKMYNI